MAWFNINGLETVLDGVDIGGSNKRQQIEQKNIITNSDGTHI